MQGYFKRLLPPQIDVKYFEDTPIASIRNLSLSSDYMSCEHGQSINQSSREIKLAFYVRVPDINAYMPDEDIDSEHRQKYTER